MLYFCVTREHAYTITCFLADWASTRLQKNVQYIPYDILPLVSEIEPATFLFTDIERLNDLQRQIAGDFCTKLAAFNNSIRIFNAPHLVLSRYELMRRLHDTGNNTFNVYRAVDINCKPRYPVFLRMDNDHEGPRSKLLHSREEVDRKLLHLAMQGLDIEHVLLVEFCDTVDHDGYYRKYAAFRIGDRIIAGHLIFNTDWLVKEGRPPFAESHVHEKKRYVRDNPHENEVRKIFDLAGIIYGRIDYSMLNNNIQTWEINTNPILNQPREHLLKERKEIIPEKEQLAKKLEDALLFYNYAGDARTGTAAGHKIRIQWDTIKYLQPSSGF